MKDIYVVWCFMAACLVIPIIIIILHFKPLVINETKKNVLFVFFMIGGLWGIYKIAYQQNKNNSKKYYQSYMRNVSKTKVYVTDEYIKGFTFSYIIYKKGLSIGNKALFGHIYSYAFNDSISKKYFKVYFADDNNRYKMHPLTYAIENKNIYVFINQEDLKSSKYGTKENPIPVFNYTGIDKKIEITSQQDDGSAGMQNIEPTEEEYEHNVITYLTYVMPEEEFKKRFEKK